MNTEFNNYYTSLAEAFASGELFFTRNTDCLHNAAIMKLMLEKGTRISMYCGSMSIFKNKFYSNILDDNGKPDIDIKRQVCEAFVDFINRPGTHIDIILEKEPNNLIDDLIFDVSYLNNDSVNIFQIPNIIREKSNLNHFSFIDNSEITRLETDPVQHTALCKIGLSDKINSPVESFNTLLEASSRVNIANC
ncbi:MAG: hypothetical protein K2M55_02745 [Muribaculaceae bacterium]|nr:hypothetical protein [Muribaculaceae bacterium]